MKRMLGGLACLALVGSLAVPLFAAEGVTLSNRITSNGQTMTTQVQIIKDKMRAEIVVPNGGRQIVIFDGPRQIMNIVMVDQRQYMEMTKAQIDQMAAMMQQMMASIPPEARSQMESAMRGRGMAMGPQAARIEYRKTGTEQVGQWTCDKYEGTQNGQKVTEICTVPPTAVGLTAADVAVMAQLAEMFKSMASMVPQGATNSFGIGKMEEQGFDGMPIKSTVTIGGQQTTSELTSVTRGDIPDAQFQVPADFRKMDMPMMGGMGGMRMGGRGQ